MMVGVCGQKTRLPAAMLVSVWCIATLLLSGSVLGKNESHESFIRMSFLGADGYPLEVLEPVVGERVTVAVDVLTPTWFVKAPRFPHLKIRDAINVKSESFATNFSESIERVTYAGQRREYTIFPQREGQFVIDGIEVTVWAATASGKPSPAQTLRSRPALIHVKAQPAGAQQSGSSSLLVANNVQLKQNVSTAGDSLRVGDVVVREVEIVAEGTLGMLISPIVWPAARGLSQTSLPAEVSDQTNRGDFYGHRRETRQYRLLKAGELSLPALSVSWWDGSQWQVSSLPEQAISVGAGGAFGGQAASPLQPLAVWLGRMSAWRLVALFVVLLLIVPVVLWGASRAMSLVRRYWCARCEGEAAHYQRLQRALMSSRAKSVLERYYQWRASTPRPQFLLPNEADPLWGQVCLLADQGKSISGEQRRQLKLLFADCRRTDLAKTAPQTGQKPVHLQSLNPR